MIITSLSKRSGQVNFNSFVQCRIEIDRSMKDILIVLLRICHLVLRSRQIRQKNRRIAQFDTKHIRLLRSIVLQTRRVTPCLTRAQHSWFSHIETIEVKGKRTLPLHFSFL